MAVAKLGVVYTPRAVVAPMVERVLAPLVAGKSPDQILELRVCDFAIGEGAFLVEIVKFLAAAHGGPDAVRLVAERCIAGADIDPIAVASARATLEALAGTPLALDLRIGDALAIDWPQFDAVVGNPPYIRQEKLSPTHKLALRSFASFDGVADLYVYFIELAHRLTRKGGSYSLIVSQKWLTAAYARPLRSFLEREAQISIVDVDQKAFPDHDAFPCILVGTPRIAPGPARGEPWHRNTDRDAVLIDSWAKRWPALGDSLTPARGVVTGCNRAFVISREARDRIVDEDPACEPMIRPFLKGRDVRRWLPAYEDRYLLVMDRGCELPDAIARHLTPFRSALEPGSGRKPGRYRWYELQDPVGALAKSRAPRLFYQDIQTRPACCIDEPGLSRRGSAAESQRGVIDEPGLPRRGSAAESQRGVVDEPGLSRRGSAAESQRGVIDEPGLSRRGSAAEWQRGVVDEPGLSRRGSAAEWQRGVVDEPGLSRRGSAAEWQRGVIDEPGLPRRGSAAESQRGVVDTTGVVPDTTVWTLGTGDRFLLALLNSQLYHWYARRRFPPALNGAVRPKLEYMRRLPIAQPSAELRARIATADDRDVDALICEAYEVSGSLIK